MTNITKFAVAALAASLLLAKPAEARIWRVNNNSGVNSDFKQISTAAASASVLAGDTLYVEGSATSYSTVNLGKRLTIIATGYLLTGTGANAGLQYNPNKARVDAMYIDSLSSGSVIQGLSLNGYLNADVDDITFSSCELSLNDFTNVPFAKCTNLVVSKCFGSLSLANYTLEAPKITNNILSTTNIPKALNGLVRNNVLIGQCVVSNSYVSNNIFVSSPTLFSSTVKYNIAVSNSLPAGNNNQNSVPSASIFELTGSNDGRYQLKSGSPAIGAGEPIGGVTPDAGAFGTADPYRLSGIPPIPTIYSLTVPTSIPTTSTTITISFSTRSNN